MLARDGAEQSNVPFVVGESAGVLLERGFDEGDGEFIGDPASKEDGRGTADDLHEATMFGSVRNYLKSLPDFSPGCRGSRHAFDLSTVYSSPELREDLAH